MKKFGLIGSGISDSGSPALFKAAYNGKYAYDLLDGTDFKALLSRFKKDYAAVNVTSPFKEQAFACTDGRTDAAQLCGSANMLIMGPDGRITADNSDFEGVTISIMSAYAVAGTDVDDEDSFADFLADKTALVVGCGGAGKAAAAAAVTLGYGRTILMNRTVSKAQDTANGIRKFYGDIADDELEVLPIEKFKDSFKEADLIIYAASEGLDCDLSDIAPDNGRLVLEANYKKPWLEQWKDRYTYISGLNWLYNQALVSYMEFTGEDPDEDAMKQVL